VTKGAAGDLRELALVFLKVGTVAFGGPAAHIAMMEDEVVHRRKWLSREAFLDYLGATNLIPGPNSTELAIHIGHARADWRGLLVAGIAFILPAALIVTALAWASVEYGTVPAASGLLYGVKPVVIAIVAQATWRLAQTAIRTPTLALLAALTLGGTALGLSELTLLAAAGLIAMLTTSGAPRSDTPAIAPLAIPWIGVSAAGATAAAAATPFTFATLFTTFAKIGAVLFGSGYVLIAFLRADFVERLGWLTNPQLLDAVAIGQVTPGPVFTTVTFVGYLMAGVPGALVATVGIFLPAFVFVAISGPVTPRLRRSPRASAALDGVIVASLAIMLAVTVVLGRAALVDPLTVLIAVAAAIALTRFKVNATWLIGAGALVGLPHG
jgi:chromate transporter